MKRRLFWIFVALQAAIPVGVAGLREADVAFAQHVLLRVAPVDPRDLFRGQYVALSYDISRLPQAARARSIELLGREVAPRVQQLLALETADA